MPLPKTLTVDEVKELFTLFLREYPKLKSTCQVVDVVDNSCINAVENFYTQSQEEQLQKEQYLLVHYQNHWMVVLLKKFSPMKYSVILLDAANSDQQIFGFFLQLQMLFERHNNFSTQVTLVVPSALTKKGIQRDGHLCAVFAWEHFQLVVSTEGFHDKILKAAETNKEQIEAERDHHIRFIQDPITPWLEEKNPQAVPYIKSVTEKLISCYLAYRYLPSELGALFINLQNGRHDCLIRKTVYSEVEKWRIEKRHKEDKDKWVVHNVRIEFQLATYRAQLDKQSPPTPSTFLIDEICATHNSAGQSYRAFRRAAAYGLPHQVKILIQHLPSQPGFNFDINTQDETSGSRRSALHQAVINGCLPGNISKKILYREVINTLLVHGASLDLADAEGKTAVKHAAKDPEILDDLLQWQRDQKEALNGHVASLTM